MIVLGVDPGFANLGLAVVDLAPGREAFSLTKLLHSRSMSVGTKAAPLLFADRLLPVLEEIWDKYGPFDAVAAETPTLLMRQVRHTALIWHVMGIITSWASVKGLPFRHLHPVALKRAALRCDGKTLDTRDYPKKSAIKLLINTLLGSSGRTSHENDAILAVLACYGFREGVLA